MLFSATTLVRPAFVLLPFFLAIGVPLLVPSAAQPPPRSASWAALALAAALTLVPWFTYNYVYLGHFTLSPAGGIGRGLWEGSGRAAGPDAFRPSSRTLAEQRRSRDELDARVRDDRRRDRPGARRRCCNYVHEWRDIRDIWDTPTDPMERARARVVADQEYLRAALEHIRADPVGHVDAPR